MKTYRKTLALILAGLVLVSASTGMAAKRVALVIGNDVYESLPSLNNAKKDARDIASKLKTLGFDVILKTNAGSRDIARALAQFEVKLQGAEAGLVFYAGHGIQADAINYLIPSDARIEVEEDLRFEGIDSAEFLKSMARADAPINLVILDACRDNPLPRRTRSAARGLAVVEVPSAIKGTAILYSAGKGEAAADGPRGGNGVFTGALLAALNKPGLTVEQVFKDTARTVSRATRGRQTPWNNSSLTGDFYFNTAKPAARPAARPAASATQPNTEIVFWQSIKDSDNAAMFYAYLKRYPTGVFAEVAHIKIGELKPTQTAALQPVQATPSAEPIRSEIREAQSLLTALGYDTRGVDGVAGPGTLAALQRFRAAFRMTGNGIDNAVLTALRNVSRAQQIANTRNEALARQTATTTTTSTRHSREGGSPSITRSLKPGDKFRDCENALVASAGSHPSDVFCGPEMVVVPAGSFMMGSNDGDKDEKPVHRVTIPRPFAAGVYEVTQAEWRAVMGNNPSRFKGYRNPVEQVSWDDAKDYLRRLSRKTGVEYRLLSESEWEYAARAGSRTKYPWGNGISKSQAKYNDGNGTVSVGSYRANAFGLYDTVGNVWEWTEDCWNDSYSGAPSNGKSRTTGNCRGRVLRGGSWDVVPGNVRSADRDWTDSGGRYYYGGFRVARSLPRTN